MESIDIEWRAPDFLCDPTTRVRVKDGLASICDVIAAVTGQSAEASRKLWARLLEAHPTLADICTSVQFPMNGPGRPHATPATDAKGIVQIVMVLPGNVAADYRRRMSDVIVRYMGGDPSLVDEIYANRQAQMQLAADDPENPMRMFGEAVEENEDCELLNAKVALTRAETARLLAERKVHTLQGLVVAHQFRDRLSTGLREKYDAAVIAAVEDAVLPPGKAAGDFMDAAEYLRVRGHTDEQIGRMAGEFGKLLKLRLSNEGLESDFTNTQHFGGDEREVLLYNRQDHRQLLDSAYEAFKQRPLFQRVCPTDSAMQQRALQDVQAGRGMSKASSSRGQRGGK